MYIKTRNIQISFVPWVPGMIRVPLLFIFDISSKHQRRYTLSYYNIYFTKASVSVLILNKTF